MSRRRNLPAWLEGMRQTKVGNTRGTWYPEAEELATELEHPLVFERTHKRS